MNRNLLAAVLRRPVAMSMLFLAISVLGAYSWLRIPVELLPVLTGQKLNVEFYRHGSEPETLEREVLIPLETRTKLIPGIRQTWGEIKGSQGSFNIEFDSQTNRLVRDLEVRNIAADLNRNQPKGSWIRVSSEDSTVLSRFVMTVQVTGGNDVNSLRSLVDEQIEPGVAAVPGVSRVFVSGGAPEQIHVTVDPIRSAEFGISFSSLSGAVERQMMPRQNLGVATNAHTARTVLLDLRPAGLTALGQTRVDSDRPVRLDHVADIQQLAAEQKSVFRVNGKPSIGLIVFQNEGDNLVQLGLDLRAYIEQLRTDFQHLGLDFIIGFDASEIVETQLSRLKTLAASGFFIALIILYLFLRQWQAVAVVAISVPVSMLAAGAALYLGGYSLNLLTLSGLAVGIGMLVDNAIVVYEAVQRCLERGMDAFEASISGVQRTVRAIAAASATSAVVFLPVLFLVESPLMRQILEVVAAAILFPLLSSLIVAVFLVPILARQLAAPAALKRLRNQRNADGSRRRQRGSLARDLLSAVLKMFLRRPIPALASLALLIMLSIVIALPWVISGSTSQLAGESDQVRMEVEFASGNTLQTAGTIFSRFESALSDLDGIARVESSYEETQGTLTVYLDPDIQGASANDVRAAVDLAALGLDDVQLRPLGSSGQGSGSGPSGDSGSDSLFGNAPAMVSVSGPEMARLKQLADDLRERLLAIPQMQSVNLSTREGRDEIEIRAAALALDNYGLSSTQVLDTLQFVGREGMLLPLGFTTPRGREIPVLIRQQHVAHNSVISSLEQLPVSGGQGVLPLGELVRGQRKAPPTAVAHRDGQRQIDLAYRFSNQVSTVGPRRLELERAVRATVRAAHRPAGYTIEAPEPVTKSGWSKTVVAPILFLLFAVLAVAFESLILPLLVLVAVPLSVLGAIWGLIISGTSGNLMALVGVVVLLGLTVNPAILLVDRMQQRVLKGGASHGSAALAAVRERARPVLMTSATTIAGLWPLSLSTGSELELWPPFAIVVMGGLVTSTLLTLLVVPAGFVVLSRVDELFTRLGTWRSLAWFLITTFIMTSLVMSGHVDALHYQILAGLAVGGLLLLVFAFFISSPVSAIDANNTVALEARHLSKIYGRAGPIDRVLLKNKSEQVMLSSELAEQGRERSLAYAVLFLGSLYLSLNLQTLFWRIVATYICAGLLTKLLMNLYKAVFPSRVQVTAREGGRSTLNKWLSGTMPWIVLLTLAAAYTFAPILNGEGARLAPAGVIVMAMLTAIIQIGRQQARRIASGELSAVREYGRFWRFRAGLRSLCLTLFGGGLARQEVMALDTVHFCAQPGMTGVLGPNGAGKTTMLRMLAAVLVPSNGTMHYCGQERRKIGRQLPGLIGYLPQSFGLPGHLTAREYLEYFALLYGVGDRATRNARIEKLLREVGLDQRQHEAINSFSGGMRQRVAVARTLLREPPIIIVDEPTVGLDPRERIRFRNLLSKLAVGRIVLFSTHVVEDVAVSCQRVIVLGKGKMLYNDQPQALADLASGRVWGVSLEQNEARVFEKEHKVIDQIPEPGGRVHFRILSKTQPHDGAQPQKATLEDGYFMLLHRSTDT